MNRLLSFLLLIFAASTSLPTSAQVTGFNIVKPAGAPGAILTLPGSTRRLALNCATGCSTANVAAWSITSTTGGASAKLIPSPTGNFLDLVLDPKGGSCPVTGSASAYTITPTATVTLTATSSD